MKQNQPFHIRHVQLTDDALINTLFQQKERLYVVCWYQSIALAHFYTDPGIKIYNPLNYIWHHVLPALKAYINDPLLLMQLQKSFESAKSDFNQLIAEALKSELPGELPHSVPLSVIICTASRSAALQTCLESIFKQTCLPQEVIVVDNTPAADTEAICQQWPVNYVKEYRRGLSYARNTGIRHATCQVVAWTDDDVMVHPLWSYRTWQVFQNPQTDVSLGLVLAAGLHTESQQVFEKNWSFNRGYIPQQYDQKWFRERFKYGPPVWELGAGANMAFRKKVFEEVGNFDVRLGAGASGCSEDSEIWFRILKNNGHIQYDPKPVVFHMHRNSMKVLKKQLHSYMKGFVVAALIQQQQLPAANYKRQLFRVLPMHYLRLIKTGFPKFKLRYATLGSEITGILKGFWFYRKNKKNDKVLS